MSERNGNYLNKMSNNRFLISPLCRPKGWFSKGPESYNSVSYRVQRTIWVGAEKKGIVLECYKEDILFGVAKY